MKIDIRAQAVSALFAALLWQAQALALDPAVAAPAGATEPAPAR